MSRFVKVLHGGEKNEKNLRYIEKEGSLISSCLTAQKVRWSLLRSELQAKSNVT